MRINSFAHCLQGLYIFHNSISGLKPVEENEISALIANIDPQKCIRVVLSFANEEGTMYCAIVHVNP